DGHGVDLSTAHRRHPAEGALLRERVGDGAAAGGPETVVGGGRAAPLDVAGGDGAGLVAGALLDRLREPLGDAALGEADVAEGVALAAGVLAAAQLGHLDALGDDDDAVPAARRPAPLHVLDQLVEVRGEL